MKIISSVSVLVHSGCVFHFDVEHPFVDSRLPDSFYSSLFKACISERLSQYTLSPILQIRLVSTSIKWGG